MKENFYDELQFFIDCFTHIFKIIKQFTIDKLIIDNLKSQQEIFRYK